MAETRDTIRILAVVPSDTESAIRLHLNSLNMSSEFASDQEQLGRVVRSSRIYHVAMLPAVLPQGMDWWSTWGELSLLIHAPTILVYAHSANFHLWSGVLEAGGYDMIVEPYTHEKLKQAVMRAAARFDEQHDPDSPPHNPGRQ